jgi:hypothetical protein
MQLSNPFERLDFISALMVFRLCALEPAWIQTFVEYASHPDERVRLDTERIFARLWQQMVSIKQDYNPLVDLSMRTSRKERCHAYLHADIESKQQ